MQNWISRRRRSKGLCESGILMSKFMIAKILLLKIFDSFLKTETMSTNKKKPSSIKRRKSLRKSTIKIGARCIANRNF